MKAFLYIIALGLTIFLLMNLIGFLGYLTHYLCVCGVLALFLYVICGALRGKSRE